MTIRIQRKRIKGWKMPTNTVYVGRGSAWGNPFIVGKDGTAEECVNLYASKMLPYTHHGAGLEALFYSDMVLDSIRYQLRGKNLCCWCKEGEPCHADWLLKIAND